MGGLSVVQLQQKARDIREGIIRSLSEAGSGHTAGPLGLADIFSALYFNILRIRPEEPDWLNRDLLFLSNGHCAPVQYVAMAERGYFDKSELMTLRKFGSRLQGHPERLLLPGLESTSGPLGCGLAQASGYAYSLQYLDRNFQRFVYCLLGDGELNEGNIWESVMFASKYHLRQLIAIVDRNNIQLSGPTEDIMPLEDLRAKWQSFGWHVQEVDGHNIQSIIEAVSLAKAMTNQPSVIIAHTVPGRGVDFMENDYRWHGKTPSREQTDLAIEQLQLQANGRLGGVSMLIDNWQNADKNSLRQGFAQGLVQAGRQDDSIVALSADLAESTQVSLFAEAFPDRFIDVGVAEQNLVTVASGLAHAGKKPFIASYAVFSPGRNWEQIRTTVCLNNQPVVIIGSHAGVNVGADGATHQMLEDIAMMRVLPNMSVFAPADAGEAEQLAITLASQTNPAYVRLPRERSASFLLSQPFEIGKGYTLRSGNDVSLMGTGTMTYQLLLVAELLAERGIDAEVVHLPTIKPLDNDLVLSSARKCGRVVTAEEAQVAGGFGSAIAELLSEQLPMPVKRLGVMDSFGQSGSAEELLHFFRLTNEEMVEDIYQYIETTPQYHR